MPPYVLRIHFKECCKCSLIQFGTDDAQFAGVIGSAGADFRLARGHVEEQPAAVHIRHDTLRTQYQTVGLCIVQCFQHGFKFCRVVLSGSLNAPADKYFVSIMAMVMVMMVVVMALTLRIVALLFIVVMVVMMMPCIFIIIFT